MLYTNFWARAEAIADEIALNKPQVVGLQEVSTYYIQTPGDFLSGNPIQADTVVIDFYTVLDAALRARGMRYRAFTVTNADVELPMADPDGGLSDLRLVDHDIVLVRRGIPAWKVLADNYEHNLGVDIGLGVVEFTRGFVIVDAIIRNKVFRFVNTHLEVRADEASVFRLFQSWQMEELLETIDELSQDGHSWGHFFNPKSIFMVGDFNSSIEDKPGNSPYFDENGPALLPYTPPYMQARDAGYLDTWREQTSYEEGYTSGFDETIDDPDDTLKTRIDLIFLDPLDLTIDEVEAEVVGDEVSDMVPNSNFPGLSLWPSDHAGVVAKIKFSPSYRPWWLRFRWSPR
jgi:endonuclease/exonuclease/phosphatase family metal-dependent hydrolase